MRKTTLVKPKLSAPRGSAAPHVTPIPAPSPRGALWVTQSTLLTKRKGRGAAPPFPIGLRGINERRAERRVLPAPPAGGHCWRTDAAELRPPGGAQGSRRGGAPPQCTELPPGRTPPPRVPPAARPRCTAQSPRFPFLGAEMGGTGGAGGGGSFGAGVSPLPRAPHVGSPRRAPITAPLPTHAANGRSGGGARRRAIKGGGGARGGSERSRSRTESGYRDRGDRDRRYRY